MKSSEPGVEAQRKSVGPRERTTTAATPSFRQELAFSDAEYRDRLDRTGIAMEKAGLDFLLVHSLPNICYLTGFQTPLADWYHCAIISRTGDVVLQVCDTELAAVNTRVGRIESVLWERMDEAAERLIDLLRAHGAENKRVGVELRRPGLRPHVYDQLRLGLKTTSFEDASDLVSALRTVKSATEIECMRQAASFTVSGMRAAIDSIAVGATENTITAAASAAMTAAGSEYFNIDPIVRAGWRSSVIHATSKRYAIERGDTIFMEFGGVYQRYCAPLIRTAVLSHASDEVRRLADQSLKTLQLLYENIRPGRTMDEVARATGAAAPQMGGETRTRGYFGYSVGIGFPPNWVEHSIGIVEGATAVFQPGMTFHTHRSLRIPGRMTVAFSETILVTQSGCEPLMSFPRELMVV
jgi:Xaa-Pro dipeptidase